jgi:hypothetical protein
MKYSKLQGINFLIGIDLKWKFGLENQLRKEIDHGLEPCDSKEHTIKQVIMESQKNYRHIAILYIVVKINKDERNSTFKAMQSSCRTSELTPQL